MRQGGRRDTERWRLKRTRGSNFLKSLWTKTVEMFDSDEEPVNTILKEKLSSDGVNMHFFLYFKP